jgi:hypothetical protein
MARECGKKGRMKVNKERERLCPVCGKKIVRIEVDASKRKRFLLSALLVRRYRCESSCGWKGVGFSKSERKKRKNLLMKAVILIIAMVTTIFLIKQAMVRFAQKPDDLIRDDGIRETE